MPIASTRRLFALACVAVACLVAPAVTRADAAPADLRPHFVEGRTSRYSLWTLRRQDISMSLAGRTQSGSSQMIIEGEIFWKVLSVATDGSAECEMTLEWLSFDLTTSAGKHEFNDSRKGSGDTQQVHALMKAMTGVPLTIHAAPDGSITGVDGVNAIRSRAEEGIKVPDDLDFIESATDLATVPFVPAELIVGQSYDANFDWSHEMGNMHHDTTYTLTSIEDVAGIPLATVEGRSRIVFNPDPTKIPADGSKVDIVMKHGESTSQIMFDLQRHEAVGRNSRQNTTLEINVTIPANNQTLTRTINEMVQGQVLRIEEK